MAEKTVFDINLSSLFNYFRRRGERIFNLFNRNRFAIKGNGFWCVLGGWSGKAPKSVRKDRQQKENDYKRTNIVMGFGFYQDVQLSAPFLCL